MTNYSLTEALLILLGSLTSAFIAEGISWLIIYRTESYKKVMAETRRIQNRLEKKKEETSASAIRNKSKVKRIDRYEEALKTTSRNLQITKLKSTVAVGLTMFIFVSVMNSFFDGKVVARLPFVPFKMLQRLSHRNLPGNDFTDCAMIFLYVCGSMGLRANVQKFLGTAPPRNMPSMFSAPK